MAEEQFGFVYWAKHFEREVLSHRPLTSSMGTNNEAWPLALAVFALAAAIKEGKCSESEGESQR